MQHCNWSPAQLWDLHLLRFPTPWLIQPMATVLLQVGGWTWWPSEVPFIQLFHKECLKSTNLKKCNPVCKSVLRLFHQTNSGDATFNRFQLFCKFLVIFIQTHPGLQAQIIHVYGEYWSGYLELLLLTFSMWNPIAAWLWMYRNNSTNAWWTYNKTPSLCQAQLLVRTHG